MIDNNEIKELTEFFGDTFSWGPQKYDHEIYGDDINLHFYEGNGLDIKLILVGLVDNEKKLHIIHVYKRHHLLLNLLKERT